MIWTSEHIGTVYPGSVTVLFFSLPVLRYHWPIICGGSIFTLSALPYYK